MARTITLQTELATEICCNCGILFAMPSDIQDRRRNDHQSFWCPNGHSQSYIGKSEAEKLRDQLKEAERKLSNARIDEARAWERAEELAEEARAERHAHGITKGKLTRTQKRIAHGLCTVCTRHFDNLDEHMHMEHPSYVQQCHAEEMADVPEEGTPVEQPARRRGRPRNA